MVLKLNTASLQWIGNRSFLAAPQLKIVIYHPGDAWNDGAHLTRVRPVRSEYPPGFLGRQQAKAHPHKHF